MKNDFVTYEQALALKELDFNEPCFAYYKDGKLSGVDNYDRKDWGFHVISEEDITNTISEILLAPLKQQTFRWFREKHNIHKTIKPTIDIRNIDYTISVYKFHEEDRYVGEGVNEEIFSWGLEKFDIEQPRFDFYEEAESACIDKLIELIKEK